MPVQLCVPVRRISQQEFGEISYQVMKVVFAIHNEMGRFFDEKIYKRELAHRFPDARLETPIDVSFRTFHKRYFIDVLIADSAVFEFKAVESLLGVHRAQLLNYLLLCDISHGKLINVRSEDVEHEFVNSHWRYEDRIHPAVHTDRWKRSVPGATELYDTIVELTRDLGAGLEIRLYEEAITHCLGGPEQVEAEVAIEISGRHLGHQRIRLIAPGVALKITALDANLDRFENHARRLLSHLDLQSIAWINMNIKELTFTHLEK